MNATSAVRRSVGGRDARATGGRGRRRGAEEFRERLVRWTVVAVAVVLSVGCSALLARRFWLDATALRPLGGTALFAALGLVATLSLLRTAARRAVAGAKERLAFGVLTSVAALAGGAWLASLAGSPAWLASVVLLVGADQAWFWRSERSRSRPVVRTTGEDAAAPTAPVALTAPASVVAPVADSVAPAAAADVESLDDCRPTDEVCDDEEAFDEEQAASEEEAWAPPGMTQQITRGVDPNRGEYVIGILYVDFAAGQRVETTHVAFCPPLASPPRIELLPIEGPDASLTVGQAEPFGARFEIRLGRAADEPQRVAFQFEARCDEA